MPQSFLKDPQAILDFKIDWSGWLGTDTIATSTWTVPTGITQSAATNTTTAAIIWLSGGTLDTSYDLVNHITTAGGRSDDRTITITISSE